MDNRKRIIIGSSIAIVTICIVYIYNLFWGMPTLHNISFEKGYTILSQDPLEIIISVPKSIISQNAYTKEGQFFEEREVIVYEKDTSCIFLRKISVDENNESILKFDFECHYVLEEKGTIVLPYWIRKDGKFIWNTFIDSKFSVVSQSNPYTIYLHTCGPGAKFSICVDEKLCKSNNDIIEIIATANEVLYSKGRADLTTDSELLTEEKIVRILKSYKMSNLEIINVVLTPESEYGVVGVVIYQEDSSENTYVVAFVTEAIHPLELVNNTIYPCTIYNLEYVGKDTIAYTVEIDKVVYKEIAQQGLTLEINDKNEINYIQYDVDGIICKPIE